MTTTDHDLEQRLRDSLRTIGAAAQPPDRLVERLHRAATRASDETRTDSPPAEVTSLHQPTHPSRRTPVARWAPVLMVAAITAILAVSASVVAVQRSRTAGPVAPTPATASSIASSQWSYLPAAPIRGRSSAVGAWTGTEMLIWGGATARQEQLLADGAAYDPATRVWSMLPAAPIAARTYAASVWTGRSLFIWGGNTSSDAVGPAVDGALYTPVDHSWVKLPPAPVIGYQQVVALRSGELVILLSTPRGGDGSVVNVQSYRSSTNSWSRLPDLHLPAGHGVVQVAAIAAGDRIYLWSLWNNFNVVSPNETRGFSGIDGFTFDVPSHQWTANTLAGQPVKAVAGPLWTGQQILLPAAQPFRGAGSGPFVTNRTGLTLNPADSTTSVIPHGPVDDLNPTYLWTGAALLAVNTQATMSGGTASPSFPGEAAVWDPHTQIWARLPDAPAGAADSPVTIWTGTSLLIWGQFAHYDGASSTAQQTAGLQLG